VNGKRYPISNGTHPVLVNHIQQKSLEENFNYGAIEHSIQSENREPVFKFWHSNFFHYFQRFYGTDGTLENIVSDSEVIDETDVVYIFPLEVRTTLDSLYTDNTFIFEGNEYKYKFIDIVNANLIQLFKEKKVKIVINLIQDAISNSENLIKFEKYLEIYGISGDIVHYICGNTFESHFNQHPESKVHIHRGQLPLQQCGVWLDNLPSIGSLGYISDCVRETDLTEHKTRGKRFLCFNRSPRNHRIYLGYLALKYNLLNDSIFSFLFDEREEHIINILSNNYGVIRQEAEYYGKLLRQMLPIEIDTQSIQNKSGFASNNNLKSIYEDSYIHITSETRFDEGDSVFVTEKTFRPILNLQPFILVGNPHTLKELQDEGFKTFHPFIDETYDSVENNTERMMLIEKEIVRLNNMSLKEIHDWYYSIKDILIHNQKTLSSYKNYNPYADAMLGIGKHK
jgi:hypothetical protein